MNRALPALLGSALALFAAPDARAQGEVVNFEIQPIEPMAFAVVGPHILLLVCNTADNSVEIYDSRTLAFLQRVPVGLRPVSILWSPAHRSFYTANFLGDSVTRARIKADPGGAPRATVDRTMPTGDEPTDLAISGDGSTLFVTLNSTSAMAWHDAERLDLLKGPDSIRITLGSSIFDPDAPFALKHPRRIIHRDGKLVVMGQRGGNSAAYDFDVWSIDMSTLHEENIGGLGSTNWNITPGPDGRYFAVGGLARNDVEGGPQLAALPTGFVQSELYVIEDLGEPTWSVQKRDLNRDEFGNVEPFGVAMAAPTDVALLQGPNQTVAKVFVAGFSSDRIEVLHPNGGAPSTWPSTYIQLPNTSPDHSRRGPRALLLGRPGPGELSPRLFCYNALNKSISVIDAVGETQITEFPFQNDPTPAIVHRGREFLYSAEHSGSGFVSCSACHTDGTTDGLAWNLGTLGGGPLGPIPPHLPDGIFPPTEFSSDKGFMVTQSLQGLVDHPVDLPETQYLFSNAPYHWRGDKSQFQEFNEAFVNLQGKPDIGPPEEEQGITPAEMNTYTAFINTIMYPPNPEQALDRRYTGELGKADGMDGSGALRGLKAFHTFPLPGNLLGNRSCVQCHWLPESSNNRITEILGQPIETAATRGLLQREAINELGTLSLSNQVTAEFGLLHTGGRLSLNSFVFAFNGAFGDPFLTFDVVRFMREFDWGIAPSVGKAFTIDGTNATSPLTAATLDVFEEQAAQANIGIVAFVRQGLDDTAYWFDVTASGQPAWRAEGTSTLIDRAALLGLIPHGGGTDDRIIVQATEVGAARRVASPTGVETALAAGVAPSAITLEPMAPSTQWEPVPQLTKNWPKGTGPNDFDWSSPAPEPISIKTVRIYQHALIDKAPQFGLTAQRHEAPRRFRVAGHDIRDGAFLVLSIAADPDTPPPYPRDSDLPVQVLATEIFPTDELTPDGRRIWETTLEADPLVQYLLLLGGPFAPDTVDAFFDLVPEPPGAQHFDPEVWNRYRVQVLNEDGTVGDGGWQPLTIL